MDDIIKKLEKMNPLVATDADLLAIGASVPVKREQKGKEPEKTLTPAPIQFEEPVKVEAPKGETDEETRKNDFQYMRENLYNIVETSSNALNELAQIAARSQHPRAYEVLAVLVKTIADANANLMKIHEQKTQIEKVEGKTNTPEKVVNNNLFVGSTAELDELCRLAMDRMKKKPDVIS